MIEIAVLLVLMDIPPVTVERFKTMTECEIAMASYQEKDKQRAKLYRCIEGQELL
jgi:hypothetical protein